METMVATAISVGVMGTAVGVYVKGTTGFYNEQGRSYMQFRTRTTLDRIATEARGASALLDKFTVPISGTTYPLLGSSPDACLILKVPSQDSQGLMYSNGILVTDTLIYYFDPKDNTLRRTVVPSTSPRTSYRPAETDVVAACNVSQFTLKFKDRNGAPITVNPGATVASIDFQVQVLGTGKTSGESPVAVTGVRLRNMRSGSIPGSVKRSTTPVPNAVVKATYTSTSGAYPTGTIVASATSDINGSFELYGLMEGTYSVTATPPTGAAATVNGVAVAQEAAASSVTVTVP